ncbi:MAG: TonB-dependent receptor [Bacteroidetes bacterium]|nr:TonB-dependent receptor [Bacteroidota bacterium]MCB0843614.1 TonB-dependent receptor [Bacteroidota bacterium]MCB0851152.1 TonB-dependent receptor [Bacteroidota bacterium]
MNRARDKSRIKPTLLVCAFLMILPFWAMSQSRNITGNVQGEENEALNSARVLVKGTTRGVLTDENGDFNIDVTPIDTLLVSYLGYENKEIAVGNQTSITIRLTLSGNTLDEVVVVGYGTMQKSDVTGAIVSVRGEALTDVKSNNVLDGLQGRVPGVEISRDNGRAGSDFDILVRGRRSLNATNAPLVLVDGVPYGDNIDINPADIESIEILKDASSTAVYGSRGANGVVLITTKSGRKGVSQITFNTYYGVAEAFQKVPTYDRDGYIQAKIDANKDYNNWDVEPNPLNVFPGDEITGFNEGTYTDWQDLVTRPGNQQDYFLSFSGGNDQTTYSTSLNYFNEKGVIKADDFSRYTYRLNLSSKLNDWLTVGTSTVLAYRLREGRGPRFTDAVLMSPIVPAYDSAGNYIYQPNFANPRKSPLAWLEDSEESREYRVFATAFAEIQLLPGLSFRTNVNADINTRRFGYVYPQKVPTEGFTTSGASFYYGNSYLWNNILTYKKDFGGSRLNLTLGQEFRTSRNENYSIFGQEQQFDQTLWYNFASNQNQQTTSDLTETALASFLGRANYTLSDRYIFSLSGRYDGASQLAEGNKWSFFPAGSFAWRLSEEDFMRNVSFLNDLKLRAGYGSTGNAAIDPYSTAASLNIDPLFYEFGAPGQEVPYFGYRPVALASSDLKWERTQQVNVGIDFGLFENRIFGNLDFFQAKTDRLLLRDQLPPTSGFDNVFVNAGETQSWGWELLLNTVNVDTRLFKWQTNLSFFGSREKIVALASGLTEDEGNNWFVGHPILVHYDFNKVGIWQFGDEENPTFTSPGEIRVQDVNGDSTINFDDRVILGTPNPKWSGSLINTFNIGDFDLTLNIYARWGQMLNAGAYSYDPRMYDNMREVDYWTPNNPTNAYPRYDASRAELPFESTLRYVDGSYIKIKNITLGYNLSDDLMEKTRFSTMRLYFSVRNPQILYSNLVKGLDPERGGSISYPLARVFMVGANFTFD